MTKYQYPFLVKTFHNLEPMLAQELVAMGAQNVEIHKRAVSFRGDQETLYKANLWLRTALRILVPIAKFTVKHADDLYRQVKEIDWSKYMDLEQTFAIDSVLNSRVFNHSNFVSLKAKDAIVDQFREKSGRRPSVDPEFPDLRLNIHLYGEQCTLSLDSSGESLHRRGYRERAVRAPLNEVLAAGMVLHTGWDGTTPFIDPMCGSGTLLIEAALIAANSAPGLMRKWFGFMKWKTFDEALWQKVVSEAIQAEKPVTCIIQGSDISPKAVSVSEQNILEAGMDEAIQLTQKPFEELAAPPEGPGLLITNPPYDERLKLEDTHAFYKMIGDMMKTHYSGYNAWILSGNKDAIKRIGLRASEKVLLYNGSIECRFHKFELYKGSKNPD